MNQIKAEVQHKQAAEEGSEATQLGLKRSQPAVGGREGWIEPEGAGRSADGRLGAVRKGSKRIREEASLTFPFFAHRNRVLVRCVGMGVGEEHWHRKGRCSSAWRAHPALSPSATVSSEGQCDPAAHPYAKGTHEGP